MDKNRIRLAIATLALTLTGIGAQAQLRDSTVSIVAYWTPGDKYSYLCKTDKYKVSADGDTTYTNQKSEVRTIEVLSQTKDSYTLQISFSDFWSSDPSETEMIQAIHRQCGPMNVLLRTSEMGAPEEVINLQELVKYNAAGVKPMMEIMKKDGSIKGSMEKKMIKYLTAQCCNPQTILTTFNDELGKFFFAHGAQIDTAETYTFEDKCAPLLAGQDSLDAMTTLWVDTSMTDEYSAVIRTFTEISSEALKDLVASVTSQFAGAAANINANKVNAFKDSLSTALRPITMTCEQYTTEEIHLDSGWPLRYYYDKVVTTTAPGEDGNEDKTSQNCESRSIEIILPDENEE